MQTREEAICWLTARSYIAFSRDSALGESTLNVAKRRVEISPDIWAFEPTLIVLYSVGDGRWEVGPITVPGIAVACQDLRDAADYAVRLLEAEEAAQSEPDSGTSN